MRARCFLAILALSLSSIGCECGDRGGEREPPEHDESAGGDEREDPSHGPATSLLGSGRAVPEASRFELAPRELAAGSTRARGWASLADLRAGRGAARMSLGNFLCRLWTHFGPPPQVQRDGFVYVLRDRETGDVLTAYSAGSGPALGGRLLGEDGQPLPGAETRVAASVEALVALIDATEPQECDLELDTDFGRIRVGVRDGEWFEDELE